MKTSAQVTNFEKVESEVINQIQAKENASFPYFMEIKEEGYGYSHVFLFFWDQEFRLAFATNNETTDNTTTVYKYIFEQGTLKSFYSKSSKETIVALSGEQAFKHTRKSQVLSEANPFLTDIETTLHNLIKEKTDWVKRECPGTQPQEFVVCEDEWEAVPENEKLSVKISALLLEKL